MPDSKGLPPGPWKAWHKDSLPDNCAWGFGDRDGFPVITTSGYLKASSAVLRAIEALPELMKAARGVVEMGLWLNPLLDRAKAEGFDVKPLLALRDALAQITGEGGPMPESYRPVPLRYLVEQYSPKEGEPEMAFFGNPLSELTREELIAAVYRLASEVASGRAELKRRPDFLLPPRGGSDGSRP